MRRRDFVSRVVPASMFVACAGLPTTLGANVLTGRKMGAGRRYIGVPLPTDPVPSAIMPRLPSGADFTDHEWIDTYDPITVTTPTPTPGGAPDEWVVDKFRYVRGNVGNRGQGTVERPRAELPRPGSYRAGTKIFVFGDDTPLPASKSTNRKLDYHDWKEKNATLSFRGTSDSPCWIIGIGKPRIESERLTIRRGTHLIVDGIYLERRASRAKGGNMVIDGSRYITYRNGGQYGYEVDDGGSAFTITGSSGFTSDFIVYYNNELAYHGDFDVPPGTKVERDFHGWRPLSWCRWLWCIDNEIHHISADACQVNNSNDRSRNHARRPHYVYFAGNTCYHLKENMFDAKNSYHCIVSENFSYETEESAMILPNNSEGPLTGYHWAIANRITQTGTWGTGSGIRSSGDQQDNYTAVIGNVVHDVAGAGLLIANQTNGDNVRNYFVNNTVVRCKTGFRVNIWQPASAGWEVDFHGNIVYDCDTELNFAATGDRTVVRVTDNVLFDPDGDEIIADRKHITTERNTRYSDPRLFNADGSSPGDFVPQPGGSASGGTSEHRVFRDFQNLYGLDIRRDILGTRRRRDGAWDIGASEFADVESEPAG